MGCWISARHRKTFPYSYVAQKNISSKFVLDSSTAQKWDVGFLPGTKNDFHNYSYVAQKNIPGPSKFVLESSHCRYGMLDSCLAQNISIFLRLRGTERHFQVSANFPCSRSSQAAIRAARNRWRWISRTPSESVRFGTWCYFGTIPLRVLRLTDPSTQP